MKILIISVVFPYPLDSGGNSGVYKQIDYLRNHHDISLIAPFKSEKLGAELKEKWPNVEIKTFVQEPELREDFLKKNIKKGLSLLKKQKGPLQSLDTTNIIPYHFHELLDVLDETMDGSKFDIAIVEFLEMAPVVNFLPKDLKTVFVHHELRFKRLMDEHRANNKQCKQELWKIYNIKTLELGLMRLYDAVFVLTEQDKKLLVSEQMEASKIYVSPLPLTIEEHNVNTSFEFQNKLCFLGPEKHHPNYDGVIWFLENCWQTILSSHENIEFNIIGNWTPETVKAIQKNHKNVQFKGFVKKLDVEVAGAIMIVPLRIGSGMRMKILEAASWHMPIVTTSIGCEGLPLVDMENCFIADDAEEFAAKVSKLINDKTRQQVFSEKASKLLKNDYSIENCGKIRETHLRKIIEKP